MDHSRLQHLLEILLYLSSGIKRSKQEVMERFDLTERTFYRYIDTFRTAGFIVPRPLNGLYFIDKASPYFKEIDELLHFSKEEAYILQRAIHSIDDENVLKQNLVQKLYSLYDFNRVANTLVKKENAAHIHSLMKAIQLKKRVVLCAYKSANSDDVRDRIVEPFDFTTNYLATWAYDVEAGICKTFRNTRMADVQVLDDSWCFEARHHRLPIDAFRFSSEEQLPVKLQLTMRAADLLREEFPLSEVKIKMIDNDTYLYEDVVCSFVGVGRFVMGLPDDVEVLGSDALLSYLKKKSKVY